MMGLFSILAEVQQNAAAEDVQIVPIDFIWEQISTISWLHAVLAVSFGVVYLLYGWRIFKALAVICFGLLGLFVGMMIGAKAGSEMWGGIIGLAVLAILSFPLMKWCICILGAIAGGTLTAAIWYAFGLPQMYIWAGATVGLVAGGMMSFIIFKAAVMLFTSLGGSTIMVVGILSLLNSYEKMNEPVTSNIYDLVHFENWFLPVVLLVPTIFGMFMQHRLIKKSAEWEL